jgi:hypothetical protein
MASTSSIATVLMAIHLAIPPPSTINWYIVPSYNRSPIATSIPNQSAVNGPSSYPSHDDNDSFTDHPFAQDSSLLSPSPSRAAFIAVIRKPTLPSLSDQPLFLHQTNSCR